MSPLSQAQQAAADQAFTDYDFGTARVEAANGWESTHPISKLTRVLFLEADESPSERATFTVRFRPDSADILEAYALDARGAELGEWPQTPPAV